VLLLTFCACCWCLLSLLAENEKIITKTHGTITHMAPEVITEATHSKAADVYSFGVVLFELVSGLKPYMGMHYAQIVASITSGKLLQLLPEQATRLPAGLPELMGACLASNPADRPTFQQVHAKLKEIEQQMQQDPQEQQLLQALAAAGGAQQQQRQQQQELQQQLTVAGSPNNTAAAAAAVAAAVSAAASVAGSSLGGEGQALLDVIAAAQQQRPPPGVAAVPGSG
jgi:serine/threonine protein kinase